MDLLSSGSTFGRFHQRAALGLGTFKLDVITRFSPLQAALRALGSFTATMITQEHLYIFEMESGFTKTTREMVHFP